MLYENDTAQTGLWLSDIPREYIKELARHIFRTHREIQQIEFLKYFHKSGTCSRHNHFRIELPQVIEGLKPRLTHRFKYNMRHKKKLLEADAGPLVFEEYEAENFPDDLFTSYFRLKEKTHKRNYHMTDKQYIDTYHVSNAYVIRNRNGEIISLVLSCEQCPAAYIENLTYDTAYSKYSPGEMVYHYFLEMLIKKGKKELYLSGGNYEYKRHYDSIEEFVYSGVIHRHFHKRIFFVLKRELRKIFFEMLTVSAPTAKKILPSRLINYLKAIILRR